MRRKHLSPGERAVYRTAHLAAYSRTEHHYKTFEEVCKNGWIEGAKVFYPKLPRTTFEELKCAYDLAVKYDNSKLLSTLYQLDGLMLEKGISLNVSVLDSDCDSALVLLWFLRNIARSFRECFNTLKQIFGKAYWLGHPRRMLLAYHLIQNSSENNILKIPPKKRLSGWFPEFDPSQLGHRKCRRLAQKLQISADAS